MPWIEVHVGRGARPRYRVKDTLLGHNLPEIALRYQKIDLLGLARSVSHLSNGRLSEQQALGPLQWFFATAQKSSTWHINQDVHHHLENMFEKGSALHKIRRHFTTLAYLSCRAGSTTIPPYLTHFVEKTANEIVTNDHYRLDDWEHAIGKLKDLAPTNEALDQLSHGRNRRTNRVTHCHRPYNLYEDSDDEYDPPNWWERGRRLGRQDGRLRSRTMPPIYYPPVPRIGAPNYLALPASRGIMSGFPSPALFAQDSFREAEMDDMRGQIMFLEDQVNQLAVGQQALEEDVHEVQVQADPFGPRLLAYH